MSLEKHLSSDWRQRGRVQMLSST